MRRTFLAGLMGLAAFAALPGAALAQSSVLTGAERTRVLNQASAALNRTALLQGRFEQRAPDGRRAQGRFFLQRPGKVRFEYEAPATMLIVADGQVVAITDTALRNTNRAPLRSTPLYFVLKNDINLERDTRVTRVERQGETLFVSARDRRGEADGEITLRLEGPNYELRSWDVVDAAGARTRIELTEVSRPQSINQRLFTAPPSSAVSPRR